ncbi:hypothetical protein J6590_103932, partial [Homalodisca vitripennis]
RSCPAIQVFSSDHVYQLLRSSKIMLTSDRVQQYRCSVTITSQYCSSKIMLTDRVQYMFSNDHVYQLLRSSKIMLTSDRVQQYRCSAAQRLPFCYVHLISRYTVRMFISRYCPTLPTAMGQCGMWA